MSLFDAKQGGYGLQCDQSDQCKRFVPPKPLVKPAYIRARADVLGWSSYHSCGTRIDLCPEHTKVNDGSTLPR